MEIRFNLSKKFAVVLAVVLVASVGVFALLKEKKAAPASNLQATGRVVEVDMVQGAFNPDPVTVNAGDTIKFVNQDSHARWPASDPHPTHTDYPGFDPKKEIAPGDSWSFTFFNTGSWGYHDHLSPHIKGTVVVQGAAAVLPQATSNSALGGNGNVQGLPPEIQQLLTTTDAKIQTKLVHEAAVKYGTLETLAFMRQAGLPFTGQTHLLVHEIGNVAYEEYGNNALLHCDESFLAACYHGVIINALGDHGMDGVTQLLSQCKTAGSNVLAQCSHAAGHGFLAWKNYNILDALPYCDKLQAIDSSIPTFNCYDGVFMENIFGVHDGTPSPNRELASIKDPYYPCDAVPAKYQGGCYADQATQMYQLYNGDLKKVAAGCDAVTDKSLQKICYNNFARQIHPITQGDAAKANEMCKNATGIYWQDDCMISIVSAAFSVGDTKVMPYALCNYLLGHPREADCFNELYNDISGYAKSSAQIGEFCGYIKDSVHQSECRKRFNL